MKFPLSVVVLTLLAVAPALASNIVLDFEQPSSFASIDQFYNGGTDSDGVSGPDLGVTFGLDALALRNDVLGPYFSNAPSPVGVMFIVSFMGATDSAMNFEAGFKALNLYYSSPTEVLDGVQVWSGLNGTGKMLASLNLASTFNSALNDPYSHWIQLISGPWGGMARSVTFSPDANIAAFDDISISPVPEPGTLTLVGMGAFGIAVAALRRVTVHGLKKRDRHFFPQIFIRERDPTRDVLTILAGK